MLIQSENHDMDTDVTSDESFDSDQIDSDIEAELYSTIHHELVSTKNEENSNLKQDSSINVISNEDSFVQEIESSPSNKFNLSFGFLSNLNQNSSVNIISKKDAFVKEIESSPSNKLNISFGFLSKKDKKIVESENMSLKRKSSLIATVLDNIQMQTEPLSKKLKTDKVVKRAISSNKNSSSSNRDDIIEIISDSESSVVLSEPDEVNIQTNIETFVVVSSDSDSSSSFLNENRFNFKNQDKNKWNGNHKDIWKINDTDLFRSNKRSTGRYHENALANCTNCNKKGHVAKCCTERKVIKCVLCGGMHLFSKCRLRVCAKCLRSGHDSRKCFFPLHYMFCRICNIKGHNAKCCPDLWRRYHLTTSGDDIVRGHVKNQTSPVYCYNCGLQGHYGFNCIKCRMDRWSFPTCSSVVSYEHPEGFAVSQQMERNIQRNTSETYSYYQLPICSTIKESIEAKRKFRKQERKLRRLNKRKQREGKEFANSTLCPQQQSAVNLSNSNFECENVRVKKKGNFKTAKVNRSLHAKIRKQMNTPDFPQKLSQKQRKRLLAMKNRT